MTVVLYMAQKEIKVKIKRLAEGHLITKPVSTWAWAKSTETENKAKFHSHL